MNFKYKLICEKCGCEFEYEDSRAFLCGNCRHGNRKFLRIKCEAEGCENVFEGTSLSHFCSRECRIKTWSDSKKTGNAKQKRCIVCNTPITGSTLKKICDNPECRRIHKAEYQKSYVADHHDILLANSNLRNSDRSKDDPYKHPCLMCGDPISTSCDYCSRCFEYHYALRRMYSNRKRRPCKDVECLWCHKIFPTCGKYKFCSDECAHKSMLEDRKSSEAVKRAEKKKLIRDKAKRAAKRKQDSINRGKELMTYASHAWSPRVNQEEFWKPLNVLRLSGNLCVCTTCWNEFVLTKNSDEGKQILNTRLRSGISPCPNCGSATGKKLGQGEGEILKMYPNFTETQYRPEWMNGMEIDLYDPVAKVGVEFNGIRWHSTACQKHANTHRVKADLAEKNGIQLIQVFENEWYQKKDCVIDRLNSIFHRDMDRVFARKLTVRVMNSTEERKAVSAFLDRNHIQGHVGSHWAVGLFRADELLAVCTFRYGTGYADGGQTKGTEKYWELNRYATKLNTSVVGGLSRCIKAFAKAKPDVERIVSFADRRWTCPSRSAYSSSGFEEVGRQKENYMYTDLRPYHDLRSKQYMRKSAIKKRADSDPNSLEARIYSVSKTETQMATELGYYKIWDAGKIKYEMNLH